MTEMDEIKEGLVDLLRRSVEFHRRDDYVGGRELAVLVGVWQSLGGQGQPSAEGGVVRVELSSDVEEYAR